MNPDVADLHVNGLLTNLSIGYMNAAYIADRVFPLVGVNKQSDLIPEYDKSFWFRNDARIRAPGADLHYLEYKVTKSDTYFCHNYEAAKRISDAEVANADAPFSPERDATRFVTDKLQMQREVAFSTDFMTTGIWGTDDTGATDWDDFAGSNPIDDIATAARTIRQAIGIRPNKLVVGDIVWDALKQHPLLLDRISGGASNASPANVTKALVASLFEIDEILVASAIKTATDEGVAEASATYSDIIDDDALLIYVAPSPTLFTPTAGVTFYWRPMVNGAAAQYIRRFRDEERGALVIDGQSYYDQKKLVKAAGYFFSDVV